MDSLKPGFVRPPAVFLDRDGTLWPDLGTYVRSWDEVQPFPEAREAIRRLTSEGYRVVVVTNQAGIGKGEVTAAEVEAIHERLRAWAVEGDAELAGIYMCPHAPGEDCDCRKPKPGLLLRAAHELGLDLAGSWLVGDSRRDAEAAIAAGVRPIIVRSGKPLSEEDALMAPLVPDLLAAAMLIFEVSTPR